MLVRTAESNNNKKRKAIKTMEETRLTPLEERIVMTIARKSYSKDPDNRWTTQRELVDAVDSDLTVEDKLEWNDHDYNHCRRIWTIINNLNQTGRLEKIIVTKDYKYKLGTKKECQAYFKKLHKDAVLKLMRLSTLKKKYAQNGQETLFDLSLKKTENEAKVRTWLETLVPDILEIAKEEAEKAARKEKKRTCRQTIRQDTIG